MATHTIKIEDTQRMVLLKALSVYCGQELKCVKGWVGIKSRRADYQAALQNLCTAEMLKEVLEQLS